MDLSPDAIKVIMADSEWAKLSVETPVYALWACVARKGERGHPRPISTSSGSEYPDDVHTICKRIYSQAAERHPDLLEGQALDQSIEWLDAINQLRQEYSEDEIHHTLDFTFGSIRRSIAAHIFWGNIVTDAPGFARNYKKIMDQQKTEARIQKARSEQPRSLSPRNGAVAREDI